MVLSNRREPRLILSRPVCPRRPQTTTTDAIQALGRLLPHLPISSPPDASVSFPGDLAPTSLRMKRSRTPCPWLPPKELQLLQSLLPRPPLPSPQQKLLRLKSPPQLTGMRRMKAIVPRALVSSLAGAISRARHFSILIAMVLDAFGRPLEAIAVSIVSGAQTNLKNSNRLGGILCPWPHIQLC